MALWGKSDTLASSPKWVARKALFDSASTSVVSAANDTINLLPSNTGFNTGDAVYYSINGGTVIGGLADATTYFVRVTGAGLITLYDTYAHAIDTANTTGILNISGVGVGTQSLQRTGAANPFDDSNYNGAALLFVDLDEAQQPENRARGLKNPGWWTFRAVTNADTSQSYHVECLVALSAKRDLAGSSALNTQANTGDQADDAIAVDGTITITAQPVSISRTAPATGSFSVTAAIAGAGTLSYQWQVAESSAPNTWTNVSRGSGGTTATYTTGTTAVTASPTGDTNGDKYRCVVSAVGSTSVTSTAATLTVV